MNYEELLDQAQNANVTVLENQTFKSPRFKGLYCDSHIALNKSLETCIEKSCILAEELGHHYTTAGNILDQSDTMNRKQEYRARLYGFNLKIGLIGIVKAFEHGCRNRYEMAEYLEVTEEYLSEALDCYKNKYGICAVVDEYVIYFYPNLGVVKMIG